MFSHLMESLNYSPQQPQISMLLSGVEMGKGAGWNLVKINYMLKQCTPWGVVAFITGLSSLDISL